VTKPQGITDIIVSRYASPEIVNVFTPERRIRLWRELWIILAEAERHLGLPVTKDQIDQLKRHRDDIQWDLVAKKEREIRHEVMAHVYAYGIQCKKAAGIIHLGATSAYVMDNADIIMMRDGLRIIAEKVAIAIDRLGAFAEREAKTATLAFTHFQPAQPTTVGKRACLWIQDLSMDLDRMEYELNHLRVLGCKGATGTQDSFLKLFGGDRKRVVELDRLVTQKMGFEKSYSVTGQTYPRKVDTRIVGALAAVCESAGKFANDIRLLQALFEIDEPREEQQVGSSAMAYKHNPMRSERINALARYVINSLHNCFDTATGQWFERTLDDSANRRIVIPQAFLVTDAVLNLLINVASGMKVRHAVIAQNLSREMPFLQTEEILMAAAKEGGDRQQLHERIRKHSFEVVKNVREKGAPNDLLARLRKDPAFAKVSPKLIVKADPMRLIGLADQQVDSFLKEAVVPVRKKYKNALKFKPLIRV
jgi:adenylosuccinate lyase